MLKTALALLYRIFSVVAGAALLLRCWGDISDGISQCGNYMHYQQCSFDSDPMGFIFFIGLKSFIGMILLVGGIMSPNSTFVGGLSPKQKPLDSSDDIDSWKKKNHVS